jgi:hypothetical protein
MRSDYLVEDAFEFRDRHVGDGAADVVDSCRM